MQIVPPIEAKDYPGYFEIPNYSKYVINPDGQVIYRKTGRVVEGGVNPDGYHNFGLTSNTGYRFTWGRHRLMCFVFKDLGVNIDDLVVNHKNAIKGDDWLDNLEWVTYQGNAEHAGGLGITEKCLPISVRDSVTGDVVHYPSASECARQNGMTKDAILYRVRIGETRVFPEKKQYRQLANKPWYIPKDLDKALMINSTSKRVVLRDVISNEEREFDKLSDLAEFLEVSPAAVTLWSIREDQPVLPGYYQIKWAHEDIPWREVIDPILELSRYTGQRPVVVTHGVTGEEQLFKSGKACAEAMGIKPTTLNNRLKARDLKIWPDGYRYAYYISELDQLPNGPTGQ